MTTVVMYDSINAEDIPANAQAAAGYVGGRWPDFLAIVARFPHLAAAGRVLSIAVNAEEKAQFLDVETGDARPDQAPDWYHRMVALGVHDPGFYASRSTWEEPGGLHSHLEAAGIRAYRRWCAEWTYHPHIPPGYNGCQWTNLAVPGHDDDASLCYPGMFPPANHPAPSAPHGLFHAALVFDSGTGRWHASPRPGQQVKLGGEDRFASVEVQVNELHGNWRARPMPFNAPPLGGK